MKTKVRKSNAAKKAAKVRARRRTRKTRIAPLVVLLDEASNQWPQSGAKRELSDLLALLSLGLEPDHVAPKVNRRKREAGLTKPAALPVADAVSGEHPCLVGGGLPNPTEVVNDFVVLEDSYGGLLSALFAAQSELEARVAVAESRLDSLLHDQAQVPNIDKSSVAASGASGAAAPLHKVSGELPADLPRSSDAPLPKERGKRIPRIVSTIKGEGAIGVTLCDEPNDPLFEALVLGLKFPPAELDLGSPLPEPSRFSRLVRQCVAQTRRVLHAAARCVSEL